MMKKKPIFFLLSLIILIISLYTPKAIYASLPKVDYIKAETKSAEKSVSVAGKIISKKEETQTADCPYVIKDVLVNIGDNIKKGDKILSIDYEKTKILFAQKEINYTGGKEVLAEFSGTVSNLFVQPGAVTSENSQLMKIIDTSSLCASLNISEDVIALVKKGQKVSITGNALAGKTYYGKITKIGAIAMQNSSLGTYVTAIAKIKNPDNRLKVGYNIKAKIKIKKIKNALILPSNCISQDDKGEFVYKLVNATAKKHYIKTDEITTKGTVVTDGVNAGEYIISNPENFSKEVFDVSTGEIEEWLTI